MSVQGTAHAAIRRGAADDAGFTLIELLVVVIVLGILAAIAIPVYVGTQQRSREAAVVSDVVNLRTAVIGLDLSHDSMPGALPATTTSFTSAWKDAGATWSAYTTNVVYKPGSGTSFCVAGLSSTGTVFVGTDSKGVSLSSQTSLDSACP